MMRMEETTNQTRCLVQGISKPPRILMKSMVFRVDPLDFGVPNMCSLQTEGIHSESWTSPKDQLKNTCFAMFQPGKPSKSPRQNLRLGNRFSSTFGVYSYDITTYNHIIIYYMYMYHIHIYIIYHSLTALGFHRQRFITHWKIGMIPKWSIFHQWMRVITRFLGRIAGLPGVGRAIGSHEVEDGPGAGSGALKDGEGRFFFWGMNHESYCSSWMM